jgi:bacteriorhodopsin
VWVLLILAVAANAGASLFSLPFVIGVVFGLVALGLGALLVRDHYRRSARSKT